MTSAVKHPNMLKMATVITAVVAFLIATNVFQSDLSVPAHLIEKLKFAISNCWSSTSITELSQTNLYIHNDAQANILFNQHSADDKYLVLIDAGSSGSRIHIFLYSYPSVRSKEDIPNLQPLSSKKVKPGLSTFINSSKKEIDLHLQPLFSHAYSNIPKQHHSITPLYFYATAGMRLLDQNDVDGIFDSVRKSLIQTPFTMFNLDDQVRIISGIEEGINGWIATNYLLGIFDTNTPSSTNTNKKTIGVLELGGASLQLTYSPSSEAISHFPPQQRNQLIDIQIGDQLHQVYTISYLNYGLEQAREMYESMFVNLSIAGVDRDPCHNKHAVGNYDKCVAKVEKLIKYEFNHSHIETDPQTHATMSVFDNHSRPSSSSNSHICRNHSCSFNGVWIPPISIHEEFIAIENFFYTSEFFDILESDNFILSLIESGKHHCSKSWQQLIQEHPNEPQGDLEKYCFSAAYLPRIIEIGFKLNSSGENLHHFTPNTQQSQSKTDQQQTVVTTHYENYTHTLDNKQQQTPAVTSDKQRAYKNIRLTKHVNGITMDWAIGAALKILMQQS